MSEWQPIETIPDDINECIGFAKHLRGEIYGDIEGEYIRTMERFGDGWAESGGDYYTVEIFPTHWMPLPEPPQ